jgi:hypothetical protein
LTVPIGVAARNTTHWNSARKIMRIKTNQKVLSKGWN